MSEKATRILFSLAVFCCILFSSCKEDEECRRERYVRLSTVFYTVETNTSTGLESIVKLTLSDSLSVWGMGVDSLLYFNAPKQNSIELPLNKLSDSSEFVFTFKDTLNVSVSDTISIYYENREGFLSFECGCLNTFTIDSLRTKTTRHYIDSIAINHKEVNTENVENIKIYHNSK